MCPHKSVATFAWNVVSTFAYQDKSQCPLFIGFHCKSSMVLFFLCSSFYSLDQKTSVEGSYFPPSNKQTNKQTWWCGLENVARALSNIWKQDVCDWLTWKAQCYLGDKEGPLSVSSSEGVAHPGAGCTLNAKRNLPSHHLTRRRTGTEH